MSNDSNKNNINSEIDEILNEIRQQHKAEANKTEQKPQAEDKPKTEAKPQEKQEEQENIEEEFVDINSPSFNLANQPQSEAPKNEKSKKEPKAKKKAKKEKNAEVPVQTDNEAANKAAEDGILLVDENKSDSVENSAESSAKKDEADKILSEIPSLVSGTQSQSNRITPVAISSESNEPKKEKKKGKKGFVIGGIVAAVLLLGGSFCAAVALNPEAVPAAAPIPEVERVENENLNEFVFAKGISVSGIDIGGKNLKEAKALIKIKESDFKEEFTVDVNYGDDKKLTYTQDDFSYSFNTDEVFEQAVQYSRDVNTAIAQGTIDELVPPEEYNVTVDENKGTIDFDVSCIVSDGAIEKVVNRSAGKIDKKAVEPHAEEYDPYAKNFDKMFKWVEGSNGTIIDKEALTDEIKALFKNGAKSGDVSVKTTTEKPKHSMDDVKNNVQLIGQFSTVSTNGYNANCNMATALAAIDGTIIDPGEVFSFNECTGDSNLPENGYLSASVIQNEQYVPGIGGGICQAATTIYNATLLSGMEVKERANHFYTSVYVYGGLDATIDYPNLDLKMKNTSDYQIFFHTWMDGVTLNCEIYGFQPSEWDEIRTETECSWIGSESFGFEAQRVYYKKGKEVKRDDLPESAYSLKNGHYVVAGDPGDVSNKIKDPKKNLKIS